MSTRQKVNLSKFLHMTALSENISKRSNQSHQKSNAVLSKPSFHVFSMVCMDSDTNEALPLGSFDHSHPHAGPPRPTWRAA